MLGMGTGTVPRNVFIECTSHHMQITYVLTCTSRNFKGIVNIYSTTFIDVLSYQTVICIILFTILLM